MNHLEYFKVSSQFSYQNDKWKLFYSEIIDVGRGGATKMPGYHIKQNLLVGGEGEVPPPSDKVLVQQSENSLGTENLDRTPWCEN